MVKKIINRIKLEIEKMKFQIFSRLLEKYDIKFIYKDQIGILSMRYYYDNFQYLFETKNSCDAIPLMRALNDKIKNSNICIDVGANIGITSIWLSKSSNQVYSFEPEPNNVIRFKENKILNNANNIDLIESAINSHDGFSELFLFESYGHHSLNELHTTEKIGSIEVKTISLDSFCKDKNIEKIDVLKIDIEGFELEALKGAESLISKTAIKMIIFEHSPDLLKKRGRDIFEVIDFLTMHNFKIYNLEGKHIRKETLLVHQDLYALCN